MNWGPSDPEADDIPLCCLEVCIPKLVLNKTRQDETGGQFTNWQDREKTNFFWSRSSRKSGKNPGNKQASRTGLVNMKTKPVSAEIGVLLTVISLNEFWEKKAFRQVLLSNIFFLSQVATQAFVFGPISRP